MGDAKACSGPATKEKCLQVKKKKSNLKRCAWRKIDGERQCVRRLDCLGIKFKNRCLKKKKHRACSWEEGKCVTKLAPNPDGCTGPLEVYPPFTEHFCTVDDCGGCLLCTEPPIDEFTPFARKCEEDMSMGDCDSKFGMKCAELPDPLGCGSLGYDMNWAAEVCFDSETGCGGCILCDSYGDPKGFTCHEDMPRPIANWRGELSACFSFDLS